MCRKFPLLVIAVLALALAASLPAFAATKGSGFRDRHGVVQQQRRALGQARAVSPRRATTSHPRRKAHASSLASKGLLFKAEHLNEFWLNQSAPGAVTEVANPTGGGESVFQMTVKNSDVYPITPTENPRAELLSPNRSSMQARNSGRAPNSSSRAASRPRSPAG